MHTEERKNTHTKTAQQTFYEISAGAMHLVFFVRCCENRDSIKAIFDTSVQCSTMFSVCLAIYHRSFEAMKIYEKIIQTKDREREGGGGSLG